MMTLFALSIPGLVVLLIFAYSAQTLFNRITRNKRNGVSSAGIDVLSAIFQPSREHLTHEIESRKLRRDDSEEDAPFDHTLRKITIKKPVKNSSH